MLVLDLREQLERNVLFDVPRNGLIPELAETDIDFDVLVMESDDGHTGIGAGGQVGDVGAGL